MGKIGALFLLILLGLVGFIFPQRLEEPFMFPREHLLSLLSPPLVSCGPSSHLYLSSLLHYVSSL